ncbi:hypothetical protein [Streptomyces sp. NPDC058412]|uniref:hypothetical protein n=1 Tax=Streptomyces sp. NPDC058412 TaxID=3346486 RepID=UPI003662B66B
MVSTRSRDIRRVRPWTVRAGRVPGAAPSDPSASRISTNPGGRASAVSSAVRSGGLSRWASAASAVSTRVRTAASAIT